MEWWLIEGQMRGITESFFCSLVEMSENRNDSQKSLVRWNKTLEQTLVDNRGINMLANSLKINGECFPPEKFPPYGEKAGQFCVFLITNISGVCNEWASRASTRIRHCMARTITPENVKMKPCPT